MRKVNLVMAAIIILVTGVLYACNSGETKDDKKKTTLTPEQMVARGEYLVAAVGCDDCHSPKRMGPQGPEVIPELRLSGYPSSRPAQKADTGALGKGWMLFNADLTAAVGPWGVSYSANITSDPTGVGSWKEENFVNAIRTGKMKGLQNGRPMLPPMPWPNFSKFSDEDLLSIFAYLKTTKPVSNVAPPPVPPNQL